MGITVLTILNIPACSCNTQGSNGNSCDADGVCSCKANSIVGNKCNSCGDGYFNFPTCQGRIIYLHTNSYSIKCNI